MVAIALVALGLVAAFAIEAGFLEVGFLAVLEAGFLELVEAGALADKVESGAGDMMAMAKTPLQSYLYVYQNFTYQWLC